MKKLEQRITGTEMEYSIFATTSPDRALEPIESGFINRMIRNNIPDGIRMSDSYASNGARIYPDMLRFAEYATPEDASLWGTVANEIAGERIVQQIFQNGADRGDLHAFEINKRLLSDDGQSWGYHANFAADARKLSISEKSLSVLALHVASMAPYAGAGGIWRTNLYDTKPHFALSQKMYDRNCDASQSTHTMNKPLLSLREESLSHDSRLLRVHLPSMDATMSPWQTWMKLGTASIVLRLMENGYQGEKAEDIMLSPKIPAYIFGRRVAQDLTMQYAAYNHDESGHLRALDIQRKLLGHAALLDLPAQEVEVWHEWERALNTLEENPFGLGALADWTVKYKMIERAQEKYSTEESRYPIDGNRILHGFKSYDSLDHEVSLGLKLREKGAQSLWTPPNTDISRAITNPPQNTRAKLRGKFIKENAGRYRMLVSWGSVGYTRDTATGVMGRAYPLAPYQTKWPKDGAPTP